MFTIHYKRPGLISKTYIGIQTFRIHDPFGGYKPEFILSYHIL